MYSHQISYKCKGGALMKIMLDVIQRITYEPRIEENKKGVHLHIIPQCKSKLNNLK
jgi:hypothetical protein